jgi:hypothetical protein
MTSTWRTTNHRRKKSKKITEDGKIFHAHGLADQHSENGYTTKSNLYVQHNSLKISMTFITKIEKSPLKTNGQLN